MFSIFAKLKSLSLWTLVNLIISKLKQIDWAATEHNKTYQCLPAQNVMDGRGFWLLLDDSLPKPRRVGPKINLTMGKIAMAERAKLRKQLEPDLVASMEFVSDYQSLDNVLLRYKV